MPKKHDMKDVDKLLLTQSLENEFHASGKKTANKRKISNKPTKEVEN